MWQMVFTHISIEGWIIDPYVQSLFYCPHLVQDLPPNNVKVVDSNIVTSDVAMVIYGRGGVSDVSWTFTKSSWGLSNIFLITILPVTLVSVDDSTLLLDLIFVFGSHQEVPVGGASFKVHLYPKLAANVLNALTKSTVVWYHYVALLDICSGGWNLIPNLLLFFICILLRAQVGYLHFFNAFLRCCSSFCSSCGLEQMVCALCCSIPIMLYFDVRVWWLSHCR